METECVVVDIGSRYVDAVPLKNKTSADVVEGLKKIYSSNLLKKPKTLEVDPGPEFKGEVLTYLKDNKIDVSVGKVGRHKQQAIVERKNQMIGTAIHKRQTAQELLTGETDKHWVDDLRVIINAINRKAKNQKIRNSKISLEAPSWDDHGLGPPGSVRPWVPRGREAGPRARL